MIAYLKGQIKHKDERSVLVVSDNVGYRVFVPESTLLKVKLGEEIELYTHVHISSRDESVSIYGLPSVDEYAFFEQLISISGVGRRSALATLSVARVPELKGTIIQGDSSLLQKVAGIGKKTAERIVVELKDKIVVDDIVRDIGIQGSDGELILALEGLGYQLSDIREVIRLLPKDLETSEERVKAALKMLAKI